MMADQATRPTLLVLRHHGLGDLVTARPALMGLRRHFTKHRLVMTCPSWLVPLAKRFGIADCMMSEWASRPSDTEADPSAHQRIDSALLASVRAEVPRADVVVSMRTPGPELIPLLEACEPRLFISYRHDALEATASSPVLDFTDHILVRWRRLLEMIGVEVCDEDLYADFPVPEDRRGRTVIHAGAGSPSRVWPAERWAAVARDLEPVGHYVVLTGSRAEEPLVEDIRRQAGLPADRVRCGNDILALAQLVAGARLVLSVDTGVSHLATAFRRPALTLFGPVPPAWWGPAPGLSNHRTLWTGRLGDNYGTEVDPGLLEISVGHVLEALDGMRKEGILEP